MNFAKDVLFFIDSNVLITPYRSYYSFDMFPDFWGFIEQHLVSKRIILLDVVCDEIYMKQTGAPDKLNLWLQGINFEKINSKDQQNIVHYANIIQYIETCGFYNEKGLNKWSQASMADPWLIAAAKTLNGTVVTFEHPHPSLNKINTTDRIKIPDICNAVGVPWINLFDMMRRLKFRKPLQDANVS
jgi:hypothetical protein